MSRKQAKTKRTAPRAAGKPKETPLAYEMWLTGEVEHGPVAERGAAEGLLLEELQRRGPQKRSGQDIEEKRLEIRYHPTGGCVDVECVGAGGGCPPIDRRARSVHSHELQRAVAG